MRHVSWNDFGEGTIIEPTVEWQYGYLEKLQAFTGVTYNKSVFELILKYYQKRKEHKGDTVAQDKLDEAFKAFNELDATTAEEILLQL